jgi:hypothetical protein
LLLVENKNTQRYETHLNSPDKKARFLTGAFESRILRGHYCRQLTLSLPRAEARLDTQWYYTSQIKGKTLLLCADRCVHDVTNFSSPIGSTDETIMT